MHTYYDKFLDRVIHEVDLSHTIPQFNDDTIIWGQRTLNLTETEQTVRRELESNWTLEVNDHLQTLYEMDIPDSITERMGEEMRDSIDLGILQDIIMGVQPMQDTTGEVFHMNIKYTGNKRKKLDLRLPDELFEME